MSVSKDLPIAIIGAGVAGLTLALQLGREGLPFIIYDSRTPDLPANRIGATVSLAPNCVRVLDELDVYNSAKLLGKTSERVYIYDDTCEGEPQETYCIGDVKEFGYPSLRMYRHEIVEEMRKAATERFGEEVFRWGAKFKQVVEDGPDGVVFELADGSMHRAGFVVGADGIYSKVRRHLTALEATYTGAMIPMAVVEGRLPQPINNPSFRVPAAVQCAKGSFSIIPQKHDLSQTLCFRQIANFPARDREGWESLSADKDQLYNLFAGDQDEWPAYVREVMRAATPKNMTMWPVHQLPDLERWRSPSSRVVLVGDAAHALPPASGQGAAQAIEDAFSLALVMGRMTKQEQSPATALDAWQAMRIRRVAMIKDLARQNTARRLPEEQRREALAKEKDLKGTLESMRWLHTYNIRQDLDACLEQLSS